MKPKLRFLALLVVMAARMFAAGESQPGDLDFTRLIPETLPKSAIFSQPGWHLWDPCVVKGEDGLYYLLYSRWPAAVGYDVWYTHAEIAFATATTAAGPYAFRGVALPHRGEKFWDGHWVFNTCVIKAEGKYFLYYTGNHGSANWAPDRLIPMSSLKWWDQRNLQRIGVAVADSPAGPWTRNDKPLLEGEPDFSQTIINVPNMVAKPGGG